MTDKILEGLAEKIQEIFGEDYKVYADEVPQNLDSPCFLLSEVSVVQTPFLMQRQKKDRAYLIQYFPVSEVSALQECRETAEHLINGFEVIMAGDTALRCTNMQYSVDREQHVLNYTLNVNTIAWKTAVKSPELALMRELDMTTDVEEE